MKELSVVETFFIIFAASILYTFLDAWMNEKIIRVEKQKRKIVASIMMILSWSLIILFAFGFEWISLLAIVTPFVIRYSLFDLILNKLMDWKYNYQGTTNIIDILSVKLKIPFWLKFIILSLFVVFIFVYFVWMK